MTSIDRSRVPRRLAQATPGQWHAEIPVYMPTPAETFCTRCKWRVRRSLDQRLCRRCHADDARKRRGSRG